MVKPSPFKKKRIVVFVLVLGLLSLLAYKYHSWNPCEYVRSDKMPSSVQNTYAYVSQSNCGATVRYISDVIIANSDNEAQKWNVMSYYGQLDNTMLEWESSKSLLIHFSGDCEAIFNQSTNIENITISYDLNCTD